MFEALLSVLLAVVGGGAAAGTAGGLKPAALACANPQLPPAILAGANGAVSGDVEATPLRTVSVTGRSRSRPMNTAASGA
jgi:hypothetical protein